jgi:murein L,D-transpeptidase YafK
MAAVMLQHGAQLLKHSGRALATALALWACAAAFPVVADIATSPEPREEFGQADHVVVRKSDRRLELMHDGRVLRSYPIALGGNPVGHKEREGDQRTPEGTYLLDWRNANSAFYLAIRVSYPNAEDIRRARARGLNPGNNIMIHGLPNVPRHRSDDYLRGDWTDGCIAVSNSAMIDIWLSVPDNTPITILP